MSDIHVLGATIQSPDLTVFQVAFHFPTNVGQDVRDNMVLDPGVDGFVSQVPNIDPAELVDIQEGLKVERYTSIRYHSADPASAYLARLRAEWNELAPLIQAETERLYQWYLNDYQANP